MDHYFKSNTRLEEYRNKSDTRLNILCFVDNSEIPYELLGKTTSCNEILKIIYARFLNYHFYYMLYVCVIIVLLLKLIVYSL